MTVDTEAIIDWVPHLRRYARILTGSQEAGDAWVEQALEAFMARQPDVEAESGGRLRLALFSTLHQVSHELNEGRTGKSPAGFREYLRGALAQLPRVERQVLLLVVIEKFTTAEAAHILGLSDEDAHEALRTGRRQLDQAAMASILIIEDEPLIAMDLGQIVEEMGHAVSSAVSREADAIAAAEAQTPALIIADIQLQDGDNGINAVREILDQHDIPVIFVTGYPERLLTGQKPEPAYLVTKPFHRESLKLTIDQALKNHAAKTAAAHG